MEVLRFVRAVCRSTPEHHTTCLALCATLLQATTPAVTFEAAFTLLAVSSSPSAVKAAIAALVDVIVTSSDQNAKMIVLKHIEQNIQTTPKLMQSIVVHPLRMPPPDNPHAVAAQRAVPHPPRAPAPCADDRFGVLRALFPASFSPLRLICNNKTQLCWLIGPLIVGSGCPFPRASTERRVEVACPKTAHTQRSKDHGQVPVLLFAPLL